MTKALAIPVDDEPGTDVEIFDPEKAKRRDAQLNAAIAYAQEVKDWPLLEKAVDRKIKDQVKFVGWWSKAVRDPGQPKKNYPRSEIILSAPKAADLTGIKPQQVSKWKLRLEKPDEYRAFLHGAAYAKAMGEANVIATHYSGNSEWYTPAEYVERARAVLGAIDLDPASNAVAQEIVKAAQWFSAADDGLVQEWHGRVFLNPPYTFPGVARFTDKLIAEIDASRVTAAILLTNNNTDAKSWQLAATRAAAVCFTLGRISFWNQAGRVPSPVDGQTFSYFGEDVAAFVAAFDSVGIIMSQVSVE